MDSRLGSSSDFKFNLTVVVLSLVLTPTVAETGCGQSLTKRDLLFFLPELQGPPHVATKWQPSRLYWGTY